MTEEAIKECEFYIADDKYSCELSFINKEELCNCDNINDCYYKQLKKLEQERDELKKACEKCKLFDVEKTNRDLLERIDSLEQENKELKEKNENIINEYNRIQNEIIGDMEFKEIMLTGITPLKVLKNLKQRNRELQAFYDVHESFKTDFDTNRKLLDNYHSALDTIQRMVLSAWEQGKYLDGGLYNDLTNEFAKINEVLNDN